MKTFIATCICMICVRYSTAQQRPAGEMKTKERSNTVEISGEVLYPKILTVDSLLQMHPVEIKNYHLTKGAGRDSTVFPSSQGVLLKDILSACTIRQADHKDRNFYMSAYATDGYKATFSWAELFDGITGDNTYIVYEQNNQPIPDDKGAMILICASDYITGVRHVYRLHGIKVCRAQ